MSDNIHLHNADALQFMRTLPADSFDLIIADPPYSSGGMVRGDRMESTRSKYLQTGSGNADRLPEFHGDNKDQRAYFAWSALWIAEALRIMKPGALICVFTDWRQLPTTTDALQAGGAVWRGIVPWVKPAGRPMADRFTNQCEYFVFGSKGPRAMDTKSGAAKYPAGFYRYQPPAQRVHITEKPVELYRHIFQIVRDGGAIFDPFLGSGASAIAAHEEGRGLTFTGTEIGADVYEFAAGRIAAALNQTNLFSAIAEAEAEAANGANEPAKPAAADPETAPNPRGGS